MAVFKSDILQVAIPQVALLPSVLWPSSSIIHREFQKAEATHPVNNPVKFSERKKYAILGQVAAPCSKDMRMFCILRFSFYSIFEMWICATNAICHALCCSSSAFLSSQALITWWWLEATINQPVALGQPLPSKSIRGVSTCHYYC